jgi:ParB-like chromosome segregation protein Spo0J
MALKDFAIRKDKVSFQGGVLELRGLALIDVSVLVRNHMDELNRLLGLYDNEQTRATALAEAANFAIALVKESPQIVAQMIALASDEPDEIAVAERLPLPVQVEAMRKIIEMTFEEAGGAKKFLDSLLTMVGGMMPVHLTA